MEPRIEPPPEPTYHVTATLVGPNEFEFSGDVSRDPVLGKTLITVQVPSRIELALVNATFQSDPLFWKKKGCDGFIDVVLVSPTSTCIRIEQGCQAREVGAFALQFIANGVAARGGDPTIINADTPPEVTTTTTARQEGAPATDASGRTRAS
jgi:hypothetical protein